MKNAFYFTLKYFYAPKIFKFLSCHFGHVEKQLQYSYYPISHEVEGIRQWNVSSW